MGRECGELMIHPKKAEQHKYMGKRCSFTAFYYRGYLKKKIGVNSSVFLDSEINTETVPVKWKKQKHKLKFGWIVGFGFCFNGSIEKEGSGQSSYKYFKPTNRVDYVSVRTSTAGKEIKVSAYDLRLV